MNVKGLFSFLCLLSLLMLTIVTPAAAYRSIEANTPGDIPWTTGTIDTADNVFTGKQVSLAYTPDNLIPYISYYDATNKDLRMASYVGPGASNANCGPNNDWYCQTVDSSGDVGQFSSIATTTQALFRRIGIAYRDVTNNALKYASFTCIHGCSWSIQTIQEGSSQIISYGMETSLHYDSVGSPHIAYYSSNLLSGRLIYVHKVSSGGNCGVGTAAGTWQCDQIDTGAGVGHSPSIGFYNNDTVGITYLDTHNGYLKYALHTPYGANCGPGNNTWFCRTIDVSGDAGDTTSLAVAPTTNIEHIAYYDKTNGRLLHAYRTASGGNCGFNSITVQFEFKCDAIDTIGTGHTGRSLSMAIDESAHPLIAYTNTVDEQGPAVLYIARPNAAYGLINGNCGPKVGILYTWKCDLLDSGGDGAAGNVDLGESVSVSVNPAGWGSIAYTVVDNYYDTSSLKFARQSPRYFTYLPVTTKK